MNIKNKTLTHATPVARCRKGPWALAMTVSLVSGCGFIDPRKDVDMHQVATSVNRPVVRPVRSMSNFSESLTCMDHLLRAANLPPTLITSKQFIDFSNKVPVATKDMVVTSLSRMSRLSNAFRFVDYEVNIAQQDTVQNLTTILLNNNQMQLQRPALYVSGAIAFVDQNVIDSRFNAGASYTRLSPGYSTSRTATVVGLEAQLGDFRTRTIVPGLDSANEIVIGGGGDGVNVAGSIGAVGLQLTTGRDYALGMGGAIRTLVDLAMVELVGKWARVPYWQCLTLDQSDPNFQRQMRDWFDESGGVGQATLVQNSLIAQGYLQAGTEFRRETLERASLNFPGTGQRKAYRDVKVGWAQQEFALGPALKVSGGFRFDSYSDFGDKWSPKFSAVYALSPAQRLRLSWGEGFRAPFFNELYLRTATFVGNPNLEPERSATLTAGYAWSSARLQASFDVFRAEVENGITFDLSRLPFTYGNLSGYTAKGVNTSVSVNLPFGFVPQVAYSRNTRENAQGQEVFGLPKHSTYVKLLWAEPRLGLRANLRGQIISEARFADGTSQPRYQLWNANVTKRFARRGGYSLGVFAQLDNLFDKTDIFRVNAQGQPIPGDFQVWAAPRAFSAGVNVEFGR